MTDEWPEWKAQQMMARAGYASRRSELPSATAEGDAIVSQSGTDLWSFPGVSSQTQPAAARASHAAGAFAGERYPWCRTHRTMAEVIRDEARAAGGDAA